MKLDSKTEQLLNSFVDGELDQRQMTEVHRLAANDEKIARRVSELQECRQLMASLPRAKAPEGMLEDITATLERRALLEQPAEHTDQRFGGVSLLLRKVVSVAAVLLLAGVLGTVVYTVLAPEQFSYRELAAKIGTYTGLIEQKAEQDLGSSTPSSPLLTADISNLSAYCGILELKTANLNAADAYIRRIIRENGVSDSSLFTGYGNTRVYRLRCDSRRGRSFLADLDKIWDRFDSTRLTLPRPSGSPAVLNEITSGQLVAILGARSYNNRLKLVKDFSILNAVQEMMPGREIMAQIDSQQHQMFSIPEPVLASAKEYPSDDVAVPAEGDNPVNLIISVTENP